MIGGWVGQKSEIGTSAQPPKVRQFFGAFLFPFLSSSPLAGTFDAAPDRLIKPPPPCQTTHAAQQPPPPYPACPAPTPRPKARRRAMRGARRAGAGSSPGKRAGPRQGLTERASDHQVH